MLKLILKRYPWSKTGIFPTKLLQRKLIKSHTIRIMLSERLGQ